MLRYGCTRIEIGVQSVYEVFASSSFFLIQRMLLEIRIVVILLLLFVIPLNKQKYSFLLIVYSSGLWF